MYNAYVYLVKNKISGEFYYGYRSANIRLKRNPTEDFWVHYKTSSVKLKKQIIDTPENFEWEIIYEGTAEECYWHEQSLIKIHFKDKLCLNRHYAEPGSVQFWKASPGAQKGVPKSETHKENMRLAWKSRTYTISDEGKARRTAGLVEFNKARKGIPRSEEVKKHLKELGHSAGASNPRAKNWLIECVDGTIFSMRGIKPWCIENGLIQATLKKTLITGKFYKGYRVLQISETKEPCA